MPFSNTAQSCHLVGKLLTENISGKTIDYDMHDIPAACIMQNLKRKTFFRESAHFSSDFSITTPFYLLKTNYM